MIMEEEKKRTHSHTQEMANNEQAQNENTLA